MYGAIVNGNFSTKKHLLDLDGVFIGGAIDVDVIAAVTTIIDAVCPVEFDDDDDDDGCRPTISFVSAKLDC